MFECLKNGLVRVWNFISSDGFKNFVEIVIIGGVGLYLTCQANQLSQIANTVSRQGNDLAKVANVISQQGNALSAIANNISQESNDIARMDYGIEIREVKTSPPPYHSPAAIMGFEGLTIVRRTLDFTVDIRQLNGVQQLKFLGEDGNVLSRESKPLRFYREQLSQGDITLYFSDEVRKENGQTTIYSAPLSTALEYIKHVGYYEYFYILAEYNQGFQLYLVAQKSDKDGKVVNDFQVFSKYDIHDLKYSTDEVYTELDKKMADNYERIYNQYKTLGQTEE